MAQFVDLRLAENMPSAKDDIPYYRAELDGFKENLRQLKAQAGASVDGTISECLRLLAWGTQRNSECWTNPRCKVLRYAMDPDVCMVFEVVRAEQVWHMLFWCCKECGIHITCVCTGMGIMCFTTYFAIRLKCVVLACLTWILKVILHLSNDKKTWGFLVEWLLCKFKSTSTWKKSSIRIQCVLWSVLRCVIYIYTQDSCTYGMARCGFLGFKFNFLSVSFEFWLTCLTRSTRQLRSPIVMKKVLADFSKLNFFWWCFAVSNVLCS